MYKSFLRPGDRRSQLHISNPSDFVHIVHMGPGPGFQTRGLVDLKPDGSHNASTNSSSGGAADKVSSNSCFYLFIALIYLVSLI